jgi:hypothetical protein
MHFDDKYRGKYCTSGNDKSEDYSQSLRHYISKTGVHKGTAKGVSIIVTLTVYRSVREIFRYFTEYVRYFLQCLQ